MKYLLGLADISFDNFFSSQGYILLTYGCISLIYLISTYEMASLSSLLKATI